MEDQIYINLPEVRSIAKELQEFSEVLTTVARVLDFLINTLKTTAFIGLVGGQAVTVYLEGIKPKIEKQAAKCAEMSQDVNASMDAFERGDAEGATKFY
ncbi:hypothetical protein [Candidatus Oscillochloris fontis]|uniref:hypothetical protein n=1 Tax=Candidatus Oscillochloris fontis TaxID=2496868 RepID=UPI00101BE07E|nr:hypothetical protein [Candidatus Oscillochloris fontis]